MYQMVCDLMGSRSIHSNNTLLTEIRNPYNRSGSLTIWKDGPETLDAHKSTKHRGVELSKFLFHENFLIVDKQGSG